MGGPGKGVSFLYGLMFSGRRDGRDGGGGQGADGVGGWQEAKERTKRQRGGAGGWKAARRQQAAVGRGGDQICNPPTTCSRDGSGAWTLLGRRKQFRQNIRHAGMPFMHLRAAQVWRMPPIWLHRHRLPVSHADTNGAAVADVLPER